MKNVKSTLSAAVLLCTLAGAAQADIINIVSNNAASTENLGSFTGSVNYTSTGANSATLVLTLTNTTAPAAGGFITAVAIAGNTFYSGLTVALTATSDSDFGNLGALTSASPFGDYRGGASTGGSWTGGGGPSAGTGAGQTLTLTFALTGVGAGGYSAADFSGTSGNQHDILVRFRGFANGGSDKVPVTVPTPAAAALLGMGALAAGRRRR